MKGLLQIRLKAGALQYAIFVSVIIALLISTIISVAYLHQKIAVKADYFINNIDNTNLVFKSLSGISIDYGVPLKTEIKNSTVIINKSHWGLFDYIQVQSRIHKEYFEKNALVGGYNPDRPALYLQDADKPLVVVGDTKIIGTAYLPSAGIKRGDMGGHSYTGDKLIYGSTLSSRPSLPKPVNRNYFIDSDTTFEKGISRYINLREKDTWVNSFNDTLLIVKNPSFIELRYKKLTGKILIQSDTLIRVYPTSRLKDVILVAPVVEIKDKVAGNFQIIAGKRIYIGKDVNLSYPSALILADKDLTETTPTQNTQPDILLDDNSSVAGGVVYLTKVKKKNNYSAQIRINSTSQITGEIYCEGNLELKGRINGSVYTRGFVANEFGSIYQNHLYNAVIDATLLPVEYTGIIFEHQHRKVIQWGY